MVAAAMACVGRLVGRAATGNGGAPHDVRTNWIDAPPNVGPTGGGAEKNAALRPAGPSGAQPAPRQPAALWPPANRPRGALSSRLTGVTFAAFR